MPKKVAPAIARRECDNCGTWYDVNPATKKFCRDACRKEFWQSGGQLRKVTRYIDQRLPVVVATAFERQRAELEKVHAEIQQERVHIQGLVARFERARFGELIDTRPAPPRSGAAA